MEGLRYPKSIAGFQLVQKIGGGGFSNVYQAVNLETRMIAACKIVLFTPSTTDAERKSLDKEVKVHSNMKHDNVLEFLDAVVIEPESNDGKGKNYAPGVYMLLELAAGGDLFDKIAPDVGIDEDLAQFYFKQLAAGVEYIHALGVCHRDLKPENMLLDAAGTLKISDFGLCSVFRHRESGRERTLSERCGSLPYVAPELNSKTPYRAEPIDVWGAGVILFTLIVGNTPWDEPTSHSPEFARYAAGHTLSPTSPDPHGFDAPWARMGADVRDLVMRLLAVNPEKRITLKEAVRHGWCTRSTRIGHAGSTLLAEQLTRSLESNGDLALLAPGMDAAMHDDIDTPMDEDEPMLSANRGTQFTQFTQSLFLFSQTQSGARYTPHLTRFYARSLPEELLPLIHEALVGLGVKCKSPERGQNGGNPPEELIRMRVGGFDKRKEKFIGWVEVERFVYRGDAGSFCVLQRDQGNPISWRQLWKALINSPGVEPFVLKKRR